MENLTAYWNSLELHKQPVVFMCQLFVTTAPYPTLGNNGGLWLSIQYRHAKSLKLWVQAESHWLTLCPWSLNATAIIQLFKEITASVLSLHCGGDYKKVIALHLSRLLSPPYPRIGGWVGERGGGGGGAWLHYNGLVHYFSLSRWFLLYHMSRLGKQELSTKKHQSLICKDWFPSMCYKLRLKITAMIEDGKW